MSRIPPQSKDYLSAILNTWILTWLTVCAFRSPNHAFNVQSMNIMKHRQSNRTKTVDTEKRSASEVSGRNHEDRPSAPTNAKKNEVSKVEKEKATGLYCIGDLPFLMFYHCHSKKWSKIEFSEESMYKGGLKYPSLVRIPGTESIVLTGG